MIRLAARLLRPARLLQQHGEGSERTNPKVPGSIQFKGVPFALGASNDTALVAKLQPRLQALQGKLENADDLPAREAAKMRKQAAVLEKQLAAAKAPTSEVMRELPEPRMTAIFKRGVYTDHGDAVVAEFTGHH